MKMKWGLCVLGVGLGKDARAQEFPFEYPYALSFSFEETREKWWEDFSLGVEESFSSEENSFQEKYSLNYQYEDFFQANGFVRRREDDKSLGFSWKVDPFNMYSYYKTLPLKDEFEEGIQKFHEELAKEDLLEMIHQYFFSQEILSYHVKNMEKALLYLKSKEEKNIEEMNLIWGTYKKIENFKQRVLEYKEGKTKNSFENFLKKIKSDDFQKSVELKYQSYMEKNKNKKIEDLEKKLKNQEYRSYSKLSLGYEGVYSYEKEKFQNVYSLNFFYSFKNKKDYQTLFEYEREVIKYEENKTKFLKNYSKIKSNLADISFMLEFYEKIKEEQKILMVQFSQDLISYMSYKDKFDTYDEYLQNLENNFKELVSSLFSLYQE